MTPLFLSLLLAASPADTPQPAEVHARANQVALVHELVDALSIPYVAADKPNIRRKAEFLRGRFDAASAAKFNVERVKQEDVAKSGGGPVDEY